MVILASIIGSMIIYASSYSIQRTHRYVNALNELKSQFYAYLKLSSTYWLDEDINEKERRKMEVEMIIIQNIINIDYSSLAKKYKRANISYTKTKTKRLALWQLATGSCFQQDQWNVDKSRYTDISKNIAYIVTNLN